MMRVIVTGVSGFIGSSLSARLIDDGHWVAGIGSGETRPRAVGAGGRQEIAMAEYRRLRLPDQSLERVIAEWMPDVVVHCAGAASPPMSRLDPRRDFEASVPAVFDLLEAARAVGDGVHIVFLSSGAVYGESPERPIAEEAKLSPISPYGYHKSICETLCREYAEVFGVRTSVARIFSAYGPGLRRQIVWDAISRFRSGGAVEFRGTGSESRDFIYIDDLVDALTKIVLHPGGGFNLWNVGSGTETSIRRIVEQVAESMGAVRDSWRFTGEKEASAPNFWCADIGRLVEIGFQPETPLAEGIRRTVEWATSEASEEVVANGERGAR